MNEFPVLARWWEQEDSAKTQGPSSLVCSLSASIEWLVCLGHLKLIQLRFLVHSGIIKQGQLDLIKLR